MTTELEQEFFKTFGIEPTIYSLWDSKETQIKNFKSYEVYPEITDRVLLELICIYPYVFSCNPKNIEDFRIEILKRISAIFNQSLLHKDEQLAIRIRQQIQQLFKEEE